MLSVFAACIIPIFAWAMVSYLDALPGLALRLSAWDLLGTASYVLAFCLFESLAVLVPLLLLAAILPSRSLRSHFAAVGSVLVILTAIWAMAVHLQRADFSGTTTTQGILFVGSYLISLSALIFLIIRYRRVEETVQRIMSRAVALAYVYAALACVGLIIVFIRNL